VNARMESFAHSSSSLARSLLFKGRWLAVVLAACFGSAAFGQVLDVTKTNNQAGYIRGQSLTYAISVINNGPLATNNVVLTDPMSAMFARYDYNTELLGGASIVFGSGSGSGTSLAGTPGTITFNVNLPAGAEVIIRVQAIVRSSASGNLNNTITATGGSPPISGTTSFSENDAQLGAPPTGYNMPLCSASGSDGALTANTSDQIINTYYAPPVATTALAIGARCLPVDTGFGAQGNVSAILDAGDKLLVFQVQDGDFDATNSSAYGDTNGGARGFTTREFAGDHEYVQVDGGIGSAVHGCGGNEIPITGVSASPTSGGTPQLGLFNSYSHSPNASTSRETVQYVRVPQYTDLTFSGPGSFVPLRWQGRVGGVVAFDASGTVDFGPSATAVRINADFAGFRGGGVNNLTSGSGASSLLRTASTNGHGIKGEGIVGTPRLIYIGGSTFDTGQLGYVNGSAGRGSPGNAGGGGNSCASATNTQQSGGSGGGHGGIGQAGGNCNTGNLDVGGTGGAIFPFGTAGTLAGGRIAGFGGGGGSGTRNGGPAGNESAGGRGGGLVLISGNTFIGSGIVNANGEVGQSALLNGAGGGGGGGMITLLANLSTASNFIGYDLAADGGAGGFANVAGLLPADRFGPGGGGGGGRVYTSQSVVGIPSISISGGLRGTTTTANDRFGATTGDGGVRTTVLNPYNVVLGVKPGFLCQNGTIPVTLSSVQSKVSGNDLVVNFSTATEAGALGFRLHQDFAGESIRRLASEKVLAAKGESATVQSYEFRIPFTGQEQVFIEELSADGGNEMYGPYRVGTASGETNPEALTDWTKINVEQKVARDALKAEVISRNRSVELVAEMKVAINGLYRVSYEQLVAAGIQWAGVNTSQIELTRNGVPVQASIEGSSLFGPGSVVEFSGEAISNSLYTNASVYQLRANRAAAAKRVAFAGAGSLATVASFRASVNKAPNERYSFASPTNDPWFWSSVTRTGGAPVAWQGSIDVVDRAVASSNERLILDVWGGTAIAASPDHRFKVYLNNQELTTAEFDGLNAYQVDVAIPVGLLTEGANTVKVELIAPAGAVAPFNPDRVNIEGLSVHYDRQLKLPSSGRLVVTPANAPAQASTDSMFADNFSSEGAAACQAAETGCQAFEVTSFSGPAVVQIKRGATLTQLNGVRMVSEAGGFKARFAAAVQAGDEIVVDQRSSALTAQITPVAPVSDPLAGAPASFLMISHPTFASRLAPLVEARQAQGYTVRVVNVEDLYRAYNNGVFDPIAIDRALADAYQRLGTRAALLVGGDSSDYKNFVVGNAISFIPTQYRRTDEFMAYAPVDALYADINNDSRGDMLLGRFPVRTFAELDTLIAKTLAYSSAPASNRALFVADRTRNNATDFGAINASLSGSMGAPWAVSSINLESYAVDPMNPGAWATSARNDIVSALNAGKSLTVYTGHSAISSWSQNGLLTSSLINGGLLSASAPTALLQIGCYGTYFVEPTTNSLAASLLSTAGGVAVMVGTTGLTEVEDGANLATAFLTGVRDQQSVGESLRRAQSDILGREPTMLDIVIGSNVLGDPTLNLR